MKFFDLVLVQYKGGGKEVCIAPENAVFAGDTVETDFGVGTVMSTATAHDENLVYRIFAESMAIHTVKGVMRMLDYTEAEDGLSTE